MCKSRARLNSSSSATSTHSSRVRSSSYHSTATSVQRRIRARIPLLARFDRIRHMEKLLANPIDPEEHKHFMECVNSRPLTSIRLQEAFCVFLMIVVGLVVFGIFIGLPIQFIVYLVRLHYPAQVCLNH